MLKQRILTAMILIPLVIVALFYLSTTQLSFLFGAIVLLAANELSHLAGVKRFLGKGLYLGCYLLVFIGLSWLPISPDESFIFLGLVSGYWLFIWLMLTRIRTINANTGIQLNVLGMGFLLLMATWFSILQLHERGQAELLLFLFVVIWGADSGAYFAGKRFGRVKLSPIVSPGKTREGAYGALGFAFLCGLAMPYILNLEGSPIFFVILCLFTASISIVGDLLESLWKRQAGMKDSGNLLPGHGGVMDRIDSLIAAAPVFLFGLLMIETIS